MIEDQLADAPLQADTSMQIKFPDADIFTITTKKSWVLYFDGSYTQHGSRAGIFFFTPEGHTIPKSYQLMFPYTNNIAEYEALLTGMKIALEW